VSDILDAVRARLIAVSGVNDLVAGRVYFDALAQSATMPAIVLELSDQDFERTLAGTKAPTRSTVLVHAYGGTRNAANGLATQVETALEFQAGTWGGVAVRRAYVEGMFDSVDSPRDGSAEFRFVRSVQCELWHQ